MAVRPAGSVTVRGILSVLSTNELAGRLVFAPSITVTVRIDWQFSLTALRENALKLSVYIVRLVSDVQPRKAVSFRFVSD
jgi:hypothetical protein